MPTLKKVKLAGILMVVFGGLTATVLHGLLDDPITHPGGEMHWSAGVAGGIAALGVCVFLVGRFGD